MSHNLDIIFSKKTIKSQQQWKQHPHSPPNTPWVSVNRTSRCAAETGPRWTDARSTPGHTLALTCHIFPRPREGLNSGLYNSYLVMSVLPTPTRPLVYNHIIPFLNSPHPSSSPWKLHERLSVAVNPYPELRGPLPGLWSRPQTNTPESGGSKGTPILVGHTHKGALLYIRKEVNITEHLPRKDM